MSDQDTTVFNADGAPLLNVLRQIEAALDSYGNKLISIQQLTQKYNEAGNESAITLKGMTRSGQELTASFAQTDEGLKALSATLRNGVGASDFISRELNPLLKLSDDLNRAQTNVRVVLEQAREDFYKIQFQELLDQEAYVAKTHSNQTKERAQLLEAVDNVDQVMRQGLTVKEAILGQNLNAEAEYLLARQRQQEQEQQDEIRTTAQIQGILMQGFADRAKIYRETQQAEREHRRALADLVRNEASKGSAADSLGQSVKAQFPGNFTNASVSEVNAYTNAIARLTEFVYKGSVTQSQAQQIIQDSVNKTGKVYTGVGAQVVAAVSQMESATKGLGAAHRAELEQAKRDTAQASQHLVISWQDVVRFVQFRLVYAIGFHLVGALKDASVQIREFQMRVSEIRTISQETGVSFKQWSDIVYELSNRFGKPVEEVSKGLYETISNQIAHGTEAANFMATAMEFAQVTASSTADSVNLLSGAMNSFGLTTEETRRLAAEFFKTIDLGRVTASEMANTMGRVLPMAANLGVTGSEVNAMLASLTINGVKSNEALTLINNVMNELIKPTKEMKSVFEKWGVASGQAAIQAFGFAGVIRKIKDETGGLPEELAKLFNNQRGLRGITSLTRGLEDFEATLADLTSNGMPKYNEAVSITLESSGKTVNDQLNIIRNMFLKDFGEPIVDMFAGKTRGGIPGAIAETINAIGGLSGVVGPLTTSFKVGLEIFILYRGGILASAAAMKIKSAVALTEIQRETLRQAVEARGIASSTAMTAAMGRQTAAGMMLSNATAKVGSALASFATNPGVIVAAIGLVFLAVHEHNLALQKELEDAAGKAQDNLKKWMDLGTKATNDAYAERTQIILKAIDTEIQARSKGLAAQTAYINTFLKQNKSEIASFSEYLKDLFDVQFKAIDKGISALDRSINQSVNNAQRARDKVASLSETQEERKISFGLKGLSPEDQIKKKIELAAQYQKEGMAALDQAVNANLDPQETARLMESADKKLQKSVDTLSSLADRREAIQERIKNLNEQIKALSTTDTNRDDFARQQKDIDDLREKAKHPPGQDAKGSEAKRVAAQFKDEVNAEIKRRQDALKAAREKARDTKDAGKDTSLNEEVDRLYREITLLDTIGDQNKIYDQQKSRLLALADIEDKRAQAKKDQLKSEREQFELAKTAFANIAKFELPKDLTEQFANLKKEWGGTDKQTQTALMQRVMAQFDDNQSQLGRAGADPNVMMKLAELRVQFEKQAADEINLYNIKLNSERLAKQKEDYLATQKALSSSRGQVDTWSKANIDSLVGQLGTEIVTLQQNADRLHKANQDPTATIEETRASRSAERLRIAQAEITRLSSGQAGLKTLEDRLAAAQADKTGNQSKDIPSLTQQIQELKNTLNTTSIPAQLKIISNILAEVRKGGPEGQDAIPNIARTILNLEDALKGVTDNQKKQADLEATLKKINIDLTASEQSRLDLNTRVNGSMSTFNDLLKQMVEDYQTLQKEIKATNIELQKLHPGAPSAFNNNVPSPFGASANATNINSTTVGGVNIYLQSSGNESVDVDRIAVGLQNRFRQGSFVLGSNT